MTMTFARTKKAACGIRKTSACVLTTLFLAGAACERVPFIGPETRSSPAPVRRKVLRVAVGDPGSIDPSRASNRWGAFVVKQICDTLVAYDPFSGALKPAMAEAWAVSPEAKRFVYKLRPGVKFHNGREVTAEDFVWSMSRFASPTKGSVEHFLLEKVAGYREVRDGQAELLSGIKAVDSRTLQIDLLAPFAEFPAVTAHPSAGTALPKEAAEGSLDSFASKPICTGPYQLDASWNSGGSELLLSRFPGYYRANAAFSIGGAGDIDRIVLRVVAGDNPGYALFRDGKVDLAPVPPERLSAARSKPGRVSSGTTGYLAYIGLPVGSGPYGNPNFRKALALAVDRKPIIDGLFGGSRAVPSGFLPPGAGPLARRDLCPAALAPRADEAAAKQALSDSGIDPSGVQMPVYLNAGGGHEQWLEQVIAQWKSRVGIQATLKASEWERYVDYLADPGPDGPFRLAWSVKFPSPEALYQPVFESTSLDNFSRYSNPRFDDLLRQARTTVDDKARQQLYREAGQVLCGDLPIIPMWLGQNHFIFEEGLRALGRRGMDRVDIYGDPVLRQLSAG